MTLIELLVLVSLSIVAVSILFEQGMAFDFFPKLFNTDRPKWWYKPLFSCVGCMASIWGASFYIGYTAVFGLREPCLSELLIVCLCAVPLNFIFDRLAGGKQ
jgi:hypothetical protein